jgi:DNA-binding CsgD family transcriptional regulator
VLLAVLYFLLRLLLRLAPEGEARERETEILVLGQDRFPFPPLLGRGLSFPRECITIASVISLHTTLCRELGIEYPVFSVGFGMGAVPWAERARQELRASGETVRQRTPERREDLSPQEMQIAQLAAEVLTNREIGERLFLSHRTIGSHLYRTFPKLGIRSRSELGAALKKVS